MTLMVVVISLLLEHFFGQWQHLRRLSWLSSLRKHLQNVVPDIWLQGYRGVLVLLSVPGLIVLLLQLALQGFGWGLTELIFNIVVVSYCLGPESFNKRVNDYIRACEGRHRVDAKELAESLVGDQLPDGQWQQSCSVAKAILYEGNIRIFAVLLWFLVLGPIGAMLYRCAAFLALDNGDFKSESIQSAAKRVFSILDWLPANLLSLTFFLTGSFDDALQAWQKAIKAELEADDRNRLIVTLTGCGAIQREADVIVDPEQPEEEYDLNWVRSARSLVLRSLVVWLLGIAVLTMYGYFV